METPSFEQFASRVLFKSWPQQNRGLEENLAGWLFGLLLMESKKHIPPAQLPKLIREVAAQLAQCADHYEKTLDG
jgi:hypothetical protein